MSVGLYYYSIYWDVRGRQGGKCICVQDNVNLSANPGVECHSHMEKKKKTRRQETGDFRGIYSTSVVPRIIKATHFLQKTDSRQKPGLYFKPADPTAAATIAESEHFPLHNSTTFSFFSYRAFRKGMDGRQGHIVLTHISLL